MTTWFNNEDQISSTKTPVPASGQSALVTTNFFDNMGRIFATKLPDGTFVTNKFDLRGMVTNTFGSRTYPVAYTYDSQGRQKTMTTWQNYAGNQGSATTTWNYDLYRGWMTNKTYPDGRGPIYIYTPGGRLSTRVWARPITTTYSYDNAGGLSGINYSDGTTPAVTYTYDRRDRQKTIVQNGITTTFTYNDASQVLTESYSGGTLDGLSVTNGYDQYMRRTNLAALYSTTPLLRNAYGYDAASRLQTVRDGGTNSATYTYVANSPLVSQILFTNGTVQRMVATKSYDLLNRLTNIVSATNGSAVASFAYQYNSANQRTKRTDVDGSYWVYTYDSLGQVTSGKKYWSDGTPVAGMQFTYSFDDIGNRKTTGTGGDQTGGPLRTANYSANNLNQYISRDVPGFLNVIGSANTNATVSLWTPDGWWAQTIRHSDYYRGELSVNNSTGALWLTITNLAELGNGTNADIVTNTVGNLFLPKNQESFAYDLDGNLTSDGRWNYTWDAENRLIRIVANTTTGPKQRLDSEYDSKSRRIRKKVWNNTAGTGTAATDLTFVYDSWNLLAELDISHAAIRTYTWGLDLRGGLKGTGGVGALIQVIDSVNGANFVASDGNGNVAALLKSNDGTSSATYEYNPFGETLRLRGASAKANSLRFSTKYEDDETDLLYFGHRFYQPSAGKWLTRDPMEEKGGIGLTCYIGNSSPNKTDPLGLFDPDIHRHLTTESFFAALYESHINLQCATKVLPILLDANVSQDLLHLLDNKRHYNRDYFADETEYERIQRRYDWALQYQEYLALESFYFDNDLYKTWFGFGKRNCKGALKDLGRLSHSWQDFYAHGIYSWGWESPGFMPDSPDFIGNFWPSTFKLFTFGPEHPPFNEPPFSDGERELRMREAYYYVTTQFKIYLTKWANFCACDCDKL